MTDRPVAQGDTCPDCSHPFDIHEMIPTTDDPLDGGITLCPVKDCKCYGTWTTSIGRQREDLVIPSAGEIDRMRAIVQVQA